MSQIKLLHSGGNGVSIVAPDSNPASDRTLKLPSDGDGTILTTNSSVGKILQVVTTSVANSTTTGSISVPVTTSPTSDSYGELTHFALTITPTSATSKILISAHIFGEPTGSDLDYYFNISLKRVISGGSTVYIPPNDTSQNQPSVIQTFNVGIYVADQTSTPSKFSFANLMDEPNTTSAVTYTPVMRQTHTGTKTFYYNRTGSNTNQNDYERGKSFVTLMEVAA